MPAHRLPRRGVRAFEAHGAVHSTLATRDKIDSGDYVQLLIGTFNDGRQAMRFGVNPLGVQQDGIITETGIIRGGSGFGSAGGVREAADLNPDFVFESKGRLTDFGYEVEISIPFKSCAVRPADGIDRDASHRTSRSTPGSNRIFGRSKPMSCSSRTIRAALSRMRETVFSEPAPITRFRQRRHSRDCRLDGRAPAAQ